MKTIRQERELEPMLPLCYWAKERLERRLRCGDQGSQIDGLGAMNITICYTALAQQIEKDPAQKAPPEFSGWRWEVDLNAVPIWWPLFDVPAEAPEGNQKKVG